MKKIMESLDMICDRYFMALVNDPTSHNASLQEGVVKGYIQALEDTGAIDHDMATNRLALVKSFHTLLGEEVACDEANR